MAVRSSAKLIAFVQLGRPLFLVGGFVFHGLGIAMALYQGRSIDLPALILGQIAITAAQLMTHYSNDYFDYAGDIPNRNLTPWSGGSRVLPDGRLAPRTALFAARALMGVSLAAIAAATIVVRPPPGAIALLLCGVGLGWFYSAPPLRLVERGLGELAAAVTVPCVVTLAGFLLQRGDIGGRQLLAIVPLMLLQFTMLLGVEFPDAEADAETGKMTLVVRLGGEAAALLHTLALAVAYMALLIGAVLIAVLGDIPLAVALLIAWIVMLPFGLWHGGRVAAGAWCDPLQWSSVAFWGIALLVASGLLEAAAFGAVALGGA